MSVVNSDQRHIGAFSKDSIFQIVSISMYELNQLTDETPMANFCVFEGVSFINYKSSPELN